MKHVAPSESTEIRASVAETHGTVVGRAMLPGLPIDGLACRGARAMLGVSQVALAQAAGCGRNLLNDFENGVRVPRVGSAVRIREALEGLGAVFLHCQGGIAVGVVANVAAVRTPRARSIGGR